MTLALVPEEMGGAGLGWADSFVIARAAGYHGPPVPLVETMLGSWLLSEAGLEIPEGPLTVAPVRTDDNLQVGGNAVSGTAKAVPWGRQAGHAVVLSNGQIALVALNSSMVTEDCNIAREPRDTVNFDNAPLIASAPTSLPNDGLQVYGAMFRAAQLAGGEPRIEVAGSERGIAIMAYTLEPGEDQIIANRICQILATASGRTEVLA